MKKLIAPAYQACLNWFGSPNSEKYLFIITFLESIIIPIIPDFLLAPMCACRPNRAMYLAAMTTIFSTLGGLAGYLLGSLTHDLVLQLTAEQAWWSDYRQAKALFDQWGGWVIVVAGFSPIPYKIFTLAAGAFAQPLGVFVVASLLGRGARFFLVAWLAKRWGLVTLERLRPWIERFGWVLALLLVVAILFFYGL